MLKLFYTLFWMPFVIALITLVINFAQEPFQIIVFEAENFKLLNLSLVFDTFSTSVFLMISLLFAVISQYAFHYLDRQKKQSYFYTHLVPLYLSISLMILSSNLMFVLLSWTLMSFFLSKLLLYNDERLQAQLAVKKKFLISRIGDVCLLAAIGIFASTLGTLEFKQLGTNLLASNASESTAIGWGVFFLCLAAQVKSVQFPFAFWLPETMETPAPVSAMMHAGIVNAGGLLLIRSSQFLEVFPFALVYVAIVGAITAVFGSLAMLTQNDIKKKLAYSTISQMGMMMFACGIGAFSIALIHILAHSLYKSHAFLSTGHVVSESELERFHTKPWNRSELFAVSCFLVALLLLSKFVIPAQFFSLVLYSSILFLGLIEIFKSSYGSKPMNAYLKSWLAVLLLFGFIFYLSVEVFLGSRSHGFVPLSNFSSVDAYKWMLFPTYFIFLGGFILRISLSQSKSPRIQALYYFLHNGAYLNHYFNRHFVTKGGSHV